MSIVESLIELLDTNYFCFVEKKLYVILPAVLDTIAVEESVDANTI